MVLAATSLPAFAGVKTVEPRLEKKRTVILVEKNGAISVEQQRVRLKDLLGRLRELGVTKGAKLAVEGEPGAHQRDIERVLETLAGGGLLPGNTID